MTRSANRSSFSWRQCMVGRVGFGLLVLALCTTFQCTWAQPITPTTTWQPDSPKYGYDGKKNIPVRMDDGIVLLADEYFPVDPVSRAKAPGRFPVLLAETPYGKGGAVQNLADYFVRRGYISIIADIRGFGASHGQAAWFGARIGRDGVELVDWAANLDESDGKAEAKKNRHRRYRQAAAPLSARRRPLD